MLPHFETSIKCTRSYKERHTDTHLLQWFIYETRPSQPPVNLYWLYLQFHLIQRLKDTVQTTVSGAAKQNSIWQVRSFVYAGGVESVCILPSVYQFVWVASMSARTFPGVSRSWSFHKAKWPQSPCETEVSFRNQLKTCQPSSWSAVCVKTCRVKWRLAMMVLLLTLQWSKRYKRPGRIWQRVQKWQGTAQLQDPPIPRWTDWPETHKKKKHVLNTQFNSAHTENNILYTHIMIINGHSQSRKKTHVCTGRDYIKENHSKTVIVCLCARVRYILWCSCCCQCRKPSSKFKPVLAPTLPHKLLEYLFFFLSSSHQNYKCGYLKTSKKH